MKTLVKNPIDARCSRAALALCCGWALFSTACSSDTTEGTSQTQTDALCPVVVRDADCDKSRRPIIFVHGLYGSGDNIAHVALLLASNGFCMDRFHAIDYDSLDSTAQPGTNGKLDQLIDRVLSETGADKVDLMGHSNGTINNDIPYLSVPAQAAKVAHYIHLAGGPGAIGAPVPTLCVASNGDAIATGLCPPDAEKSVVFDRQDHFAVAASTDSFVAIYNYLYGKDPQYKTVQCGEDPVTIEGIAESFADNVPATGTIEITEVGESPGTPGKQAAIVSPDADGHFGPVKLRRNVAYELKGVDAQGNLIGYQYMTPFKRSNRLVRLLSPSANSIVASLSTDLVQRGPNNSALVVRWDGGAFRQDLGASLKVDGAEVLTSENAGAGALATQSLRGGVVGFFMSDQNTNGQTDLGLAASGPFIAFTDVFMAASPPKFIELSFTAGSEDSTIVRSLKIPNWPSSNALMLAMFF